MLSKDIISRMSSFIGKLPINENYVEKYLKKLKSEEAIKSYRFIGVSRIVSGISFDICEQYDFYRVMLMHNGSRFVYMDIVNHTDSSDNQHVEIK